VNYVLRKLSDPSFLASVMLFLICLSVLGAFTTEYGGYGRALDVDDAVSLYAVSNTSNQIFWLLMLIMSLFILKSKKVSLQTIKPLSPILVMLGVGIVSVFWSVDAAVSFRRVVLQCILFFSLFAIVSVIPVEKIMLAIYKALWLVLGYDVFVIILASWDFGGGFSGIHGHKNTMGSIAAIALFVGGYVIRTESVNAKYICRIYLVLWGGLMLISLSKTSILLFAIVSVLYVFVNRLGLLQPARFLFVSVLFSITFFTAILVIFSVVIFGEFSLSAVIMGLSDEQLTGRANIWKFIADVLDDNGALGYGYGAFWGTNSAPNILYSEGYISLLNQAHNGYLDLVIQFGIIGYVIVVGLFISFFCIIRDSSGDAAWSYFVFNFVLFFAFHNVTESSLFRSTHFLWVVFLIIYFASIRYHAGEKECAKSI
jgi:O-antigen ligase